MLFRSWDDGRLTTYVDPDVMPVRPLSSNNFEIRSGVEFSLASLPDDFSEATLRLNILRANRFTVAGSFATVYAMPGRPSFSGTFSYGPFTDVRFPVGTFNLPLPPLPSEEAVDVTVDVYGAVEFAQAQNWSSIGFLFCVTDASPTAETLQVLIGTRGSMAWAGEGVPAQLEITEIPEPATMALLAMGLACLAARRRLRLVSPRAKSAKS